MKNVLTPQAQNVLMSLGLIAAASAKNSANEFSLRFKSLWLFR